jgi:hypothetical protein
VDSEGPESGEERGGPSSCRNLASTSPAYGEAAARLAAAWYGQDGIRSKAVTELKQCAQPCELITILEDYSHPVGYAVQWIEYKLKELSDDDAPSGEYDAADLLGVVAYLVDYCHEPVHAERAVCQDSLANVGGLLEAFGVSCRHELGFPTIEPTLPGQPPARPAPIPDQVESAPAQPEPVRSPGRTVDPQEARRAASARTADLVRRSAQAVQLALNHLNLVLSTAQNRRPDPALQTQVTRLREATVNAAQQTDRVLESRSVKKSVEALEDLLNGDAVERLITEGELIGEWMGGVQISLPYGGGRVKARGLASGAVKSLCAQRKKVSEL